MSQIVNLRGLGTDPSNLSEGALVGTATLMSNILQPVLATEEGRLFRLVRDIGEGGIVVIEYIEVEPTVIVIDPPKA